MVGAGELGIEREVARTVWAVVKSDGGISPAARNIFIDRLANAWLELGQIAWQIDHDIALLPVHRIELDTKFCPAVIDVGTAVTGHAPHISGCLIIRSADRAARSGQQSTMIGQAMHSSRAPQRNFCSLKSNMSSAMHAL